MDLEWALRCYWEGNDLWTADGRHVGCFHGDEVYHRYGHESGELLNGWLVTARGQASPAPSRRQGRAE